MFRFARNFIARGFIGPKGKKFSKGSIKYPLAVGALTAGAAAAYAIKQYKDGRFIELPSLIPIAYADAVPASQASVFSPGKSHALYLWIHLKPGADVKKCARAAANVDKLVNSVSPIDVRDESNEILAGVGFGPAIYAKLTGKVRTDYSYPHRKGPLGEMPATGGDIFIHAKSDDSGKLFELCQLIVKQFPAGSIDRFEDVYGFVYRNGRDLSGFIDGTENPADEEDRQKVAVEKSTGGSYVITQKWIHKHDYINKASDRELASFIGRNRDDGTELRKKIASSHVARMTGGTNFEQKKHLQIVRQSMPFGHVSGDSGLFFIAYAESPQNFEFMLNRMVGAHDQVSDDLMRLSTCVAGNYWYFPSAKELQGLK